MDHFGGRNGRETSAEPLKTASRFPVQHASRSALIPAACLAASLFLTGCSGATTTERETATGETSAAEDRGTTPGPETSDSGIETSDPGTGTTDSGTEGTDSGTETNDSGTGGQSEAGPGETTSAPDPTAGSLSGSFANLSQACQAISAHMLSVAFAPLSYSYGGGRAEAKEAVGQLSELREKVPSELRDDVANVKQVFDDSGHGYSDFDEAAFRDAVLPIEDWVAENCPEL